MGEIKHAELNTTDPDAARAFYKSMFAWKFQNVPMPDGSYSLIFTKDGTGVGGMQKHPMEGQPSSWLSYVNVKSASGSAAKALELGATIIQPATDIGIGVFAIFADPTGAVIAIWEQKESPSDEKKAGAAKPTKSAKAKAKKPAKEKPKKKKAKKPAKEKKAKKPAKEKKAKKPAKEKAKKKKPAKKAKRKR